MILLGLGGLGLLGTAGRPWEAGERRNGTKPQSSAGAHQLVTILSPCDNIQ